MNFVKRPVARLGQKTPRERDSGLVTVIVEMVRPNRDFDKKHVESLPVGFLVGPQRFARDCQENPWHLITRTIKFH